MFVPFIFTIDAEESHSYLWVFYKFLDMCRRYDWPIITHEQFLKDPLEFSASKYKDFVTEPGSEYFEYGIPKYSDIANTKIFPIPQNLVDEALSFYGSPDNAKKAIFYDEASYSPLEKLFEEYIEKITREYEEPVEAFLTWGSCPFFNKIAKKFNIPTFSLELGPFRPPMYRKTAYFESGSIWNAGTLKERYEDFVSEGAFKFLLDRKELFSLFLLPDSIQKINLCDSAAQYKAGLAWSLSTYSGSRFLSEDDVVSELLDKYEEGDILFRNRPGEKDTPTTERLMRDTSASSLEFIAQCEKIVSVRSNVAFEAMLLGRPSYILAKDISPFGFMSADKLSDDTLTSPPLEFVNFVMLSYLVPYELLLEPEYLRWRLTSPSEHEILKHHLMYYLKCRGINFTALNITEGRLAEFLRQQGFDENGNLFETEPSMFMMKTGVRFGAGSNLPNSWVLNAKNQFSIFNGYKILLAYANLNMAAHEVSSWALSLKEMVESQQEGIASLEKEAFTLKESLVLLGASKEGSTNLAEDISMLSKYLKDTVANYKHEIDSLRAENENLKNNVSMLNVENEDLPSLAEEISVLARYLKDTVKTQKAEIEALKSENNALNNMMIALQEESSAVKMHSSAVIENLKAEIVLALNSLNRLTLAKSYKLYHFLSRFKGQFIMGKLSQKKKFVRWVIGHFKKTPNFDTRYNPVMQIMEKLGESLNYVSEVPREIEVPSEASVIKTNVKSASVAPDVDFSQYKKFDVIVFSIIGHDFRYQRPQHFADRFARDGHRVFYIDPNFSNKNKCVLKSKKLYDCKFTCDGTTAVYDTDFSENEAELFSQLDALANKYAIRDCIVLVQYPNWVRGALYFKEKYGFSVVCDYMDDFSGFDNPQTELIKNSCKRLLGLCDCVIASSDYLSKIASKYNDNVKIVRNGTEFEHFHKAYRPFDKKRKSRPVIGYYGAVAHWFDIEKIEYISKKLPHCDIVIAGHVSEWKKRLKKLENVKLLGEVSYAKLPSHLEYFDVCLIPFDTSTNLIKATNPVKFYEYLSAGKKIVATEIPEIVPFRNKFVYLANDNEEFLNYIKLCLDGKDILASPEECFEFARENDWNSRYLAFRKNCVETLPQISIIVLCYNQLDYTKKCVDSILNKTAYPNYELIMVDNCSTDDTASYLLELEKTHDNVKAIINTENRGFAGGNNDGIRESKGEYVVLLNNDTVVTRGWLTSLLKRFLKDPNVAMSGPVTNSIGNEARINVDYIDLKDLDLFAHKYTQKHMNEDYEDIGVLAMFCVMISKEAIAKVGLLDENYGIGMFEDDDYAMAIKREGMRLVLAEDAFIHHFASVSFKKLGDEKYMKTFNDNKKYFTEKWKAPWIPHKYRDGVN